MIWAKDISFHLPSNTVLLLVHDLLSGRPRPKCLVQVLPCATTQQVDWHSLRHKLVIQIILDGSVKLLLMEEIWRTTWDIYNPVNNGIFTISTGAGFLPSTVGLGQLLRHQLKAASQPKDFKSSKPMPCQLILILTIINLILILILIMINLILIVIIPITLYSIYLSSSNV